MLTNVDRQGEQKGRCDLICRWSRYPPHYSGQPGDPKAWFGDSRTLTGGEGRVSSMADGRRRESSPTASCYKLRNIRACACRRVTAVGPGVRMATSPARATATKWETSVIPSAETKIGGESATMEPPLGGDRLGVPDER